MTRFLSGLSLYLFYCSAYALTEAANPPPAEETASTSAVVVFVVLFVACCVGFVWMVYSAERKKKTKQGEGHDTSGKTT